MRRGASRLGFGKTSPRVRRRTWRRKSQIVKRHTPAEVSPYTRRDALLSKGEAAFFLPLQQAIGYQFLVMSKVRLADLVTCSRTDWHRGFGGAISQKHLDFVL